MTLRQVPSYGAIPPETLKDFHFGALRHVPNLSMMMLQELYDRWAEIQNRNHRTQLAVNENEQDRIAEELNILEALRLHVCKKIPGETSEIEALLRDRHRQKEDALRKRKE